MNRRYRVNQKKRKANPELWIAPKRGRPSKAADEVTKQKKTAGQPKADLYPAPKPGRPRKTGTTEEQKAIQDMKASYHQRRLEAGRLCVPFEYKVKGINTASTKAQTSFAQPTSSSLGGSSSLRKTNKSAASVPLGAKAPEPRRALEPAMPMQAESRTSSTYNPPDASLAGYSPIWTTTHVSSSPQRLPVELQDSPSPPPLSPSHKQTDWISELGLAVDQGPGARQSTSSLRPSQASPSSFLVSHSPKLAPTETPQWLRHFPNIFE